MGGRRWTRPACGCATAWRRSTPRSCAWGKGGSPAGLGAPPPSAGPRAGRNRGPVAGHPPRVGVGPARGAPARERAGGGHGKPAPPVCRPAPRDEAGVRGRRPSAGRRGPLPQGDGELLARLVPLLRGPGLPATNNDLEHYFGSARYHERRASGRRSASPTLVVRGSVRLIAAVATRQRPFTAHDLYPRDQLAWRGLRRRLEQRHDARRQQRRFRRDSAAYLTRLEEALLRSPTRGLVDQGDDRHGPAPTPSRSDGTRLRCGQCAGNSLHPHTA
jgi:hypothetical protein